MPPCFLTLDLKLVCVQAVMREGVASSEDLRRNWARLVSRLDDISDLAQPRLAIAHWHWVDQDTRVHLAGVRVDSLASFTWDYAHGLGAWAPGPTTFAVFDEPNGQEGSVAHLPETYSAIEEAGYAYNARFMGDFEAEPLHWVVGGARPAGETHQIWVPVLPIEPRNA